MKKIKKIFFKGPYFPSHDENRMKNEGDLAVAREDFLSNRFTNVDFLLIKEVISNYYLQK